MRAIVAESPTSSPGKKSPTSRLDAGEVLIKVSAAGVNRADLLQAAGNYPPPPGASEIIGLEVSGTIAAVGDGVDGGPSGNRSALCWQAGATRNSSRSPPAR